MTCPSGVKSAWAMDRAPRPSSARLSSAPAPLCPLQCRLYAGNLPESREGGFGLDFLKDATAQAGAVEGVKKQARGARLVAACQGAVCGQRFGLPVVKALGGFLKLVHGGVVVAFPRECGSEVAVRECSGGVDLERLPQEALGLGPFAHGGGALGALNVPGGGFLAADERRQSCGKRIGLLGGGNGNDDGSRLG